MNGVSRCVPCVRDRGARGSWRVAFLLLASVLTGSVAAQPRSAQPMEGGAEQRLFDRLDRNGDDKLTPAEIPEPAKRAFQQVDLDRDGIVTRQEANRFRQMLERRQTGGGFANGAVLRMLETTTIHKDIPYVPNGHVRQRMDILVPKNAEGPLPLIVWVHGGGWQGGDKERTPAFIFLEQGFVVASINYRLSQHAIFPAQIHDCKAAIRYLKTHAEKYQIDPEKIGVWGASAGGHLAALLGTSGDDATLEGTLGETGCDSKVQAVCDFFGPADMVLMDEQARAANGNRATSPHSPLTRLFGGEVSSHLELANSSSPTTYISKNDPPFLIIHGEKDPLVPLNQSEVLQQKLKQASVPVQLHVVAGGGHGPFRDPPILKMVTDFFVKHLK